MFVVVIARFSNVVLKRYNVKTCRGVKAVYGSYSTAALRHIVPE